MPKPNIFSAFLNGKKGINSEQAFDFLNKANMEMLQFTEQFIAFLASADKDELRELNNLAAVLKHGSFNPNKTKFKPEQIKIIQPYIQKFNFLTTLQSEVGFKNLKEELLNTNLTQKIIDILIANLANAQREIKQLSDQYRKIEETAKDLPPLTYYVVFADSDKKKPESFNSFAEAKLSGDKSHQSQYSIVEIQAPVNNDAINTAKLTAFKIISSSRSDQPDSWANPTMNSITTVNNGVPERHYNPEGENEVARAIKQLDAIINRLQKNKWIWTFVEAILGKSGLTNKKIEALKGLRTSVFEKATEIEQSATSLRNVLIQSNIKSSLQQHRFFGGKTKSEAEMDELIDSTRPRDTPHKP